MERKDALNPIKRLYLKHLVRVAAKKHAAGELSDAWYGAVVTQLMFELAGQGLRLGDDCGLVSYSEASQKALGALGLPDAAELAFVKFGPHGQAPMFLKNATGDFIWDVTKDELARQARHVVTPAARFEAWVAERRKRYPTLTAWGGRLMWMVVGFAVAKVLKQ